MHSSADDQFLQEVVGSKTGGFSTTWIGGFDAVQVEYTHRSVISLVYSSISQGSLIKSDLGLEDLIDVVNNNKKGHCSIYWHTIIIIIITWDIFDTETSLLHHRTGYGFGVTAPNLITRTGRKESPIIAVAESHV